MRRSLAGHLADEPVREAVTMALYVSLVLEAALIVLPEEEERGDLVAVPAIWGTTVGLALTHVFAFSLAAALAAGGRSLRTARAAALLQLAAAALIALLASVPFVVLSSGAAYEIAEILLGGLVALAGLLVARGAGANWFRAILFALVILLVASFIVGVKAGLGH